MTCDRIWQDCFVKHLNIPGNWRNADIDSLKGRMDLFWVIAGNQEVNYLLDFVKDPEHKARIGEAVSINGIGKLLYFIMARNGRFVQYYPLLTFGEAGVAWRKIDTIAFSDFDELNRMYPPSRNWPGDI